MLLLQGTFRSGTTTFFRTLRRDDRLRCFYEPLHPNLVGHVQDACARSPSHPKSPLYAEYIPGLDALETRLGTEPPSWPRSLAEADAAPALAAHLRALCRPPFLEPPTAPGAALVPFLQCNRAFWMAPWLAHTFPDALFVHLVRDPRSVVWSQLTTSSGRVRMDWPLLGRTLPVSSGRSRHAFSEHAYFGAYELDAHFEAGRQRLHNAPDDASGEAASGEAALRRLDAVQEALPYVRALAVWGAQVETCWRTGRAAFGDRYLQLRYEDFCAASGDALRTLYDAMGRSLPDAVCDYARHSVDPARRRWADVSSGEARFRNGIRQAQLGPLMHALGYDPL